MLLATRRRTARPAFVLARRCSGRRTATGARRQRSIDDGRLGHLSRGRRLRTGLRGRLRSRRRRAAWSGRRPGFGLGLGLARRARGNRRQARQERRHGGLSRRVLRRTYDHEPGRSPHRDDNGRHAACLRSWHAQLRRADALVFGKGMHPELDGGGNARPYGSQICDDGDSASHCSQYRVAAGRPLSGFRRHDAVLPAPLRGVERQIGRGHEVVCALDGRERRDAEACGHPH